MVGVAIFRSPVGTAWRTIEEWPMPGDPCKDQDDEKAGPKVADLRIRMFMEDYRVESVDNFRGMRRRSCAARRHALRRRRRNAPDELPEELRHRRLRTLRGRFEPAQADGRRERDKSRMRAAHKVVWTEGLLMAPQHLQQQDLYYEALLCDRLDAVDPFNWGVLRIELDKKSLSANQVQLASFQGRAAGRCRALARRASTRSCRRAA